MAGVNMAWIWVLFAASGTAGSNYCWRRTLDAGGSAPAYLIFQQGCSLVVNLILSFGGLVVLWSLHPSIGECFPIAALGVAAGIALYTMLVYTGKSLQTGPTGLTIAALNAVTVLPGLFTGLLLGATYECPLTLSSLMGLALVVGGLFWAVRGEKGNSTWLRMIGIAMLCHTTVLLMIRWKVLILNDRIPPHPLFSLDQIPEAGSLFLVSMFAVCFLLQTIAFYRQEHRPFRREEVRFGLMGGVCNGLSAALLVAASLQIQSPLLFPMYAVGIIALTNLWSQFLYRESVNWVATAAALVGIVIGR